MNESFRGFERILVATDFSPAAAAALRQAAWIAHKNGARISLVHTVPDVRRAIESSSFRARIDLVYGKGDVFEREYREDSDAKLRQAIKDLAAPELEVSPETLLGEAFLEITHAVQQDRHDLVLTGTRGLAAWEQFFLGSTARRLIRKCPASVWVVKPEHVGRPRKIMAAVDFSEASRKAAEQAIWVARQAEAELHLFHVIDSKDVPEDIISRIPQGSTLRDEINQEAARRLGEFVDSLPLAGLAPSRHLSFGTPWKEIERLTRSLEIDLLALGTVGRSGISGMLLGNTAERVLGVCECSLLTVKPADYVSPIVPMAQPGLEPAS